MNNESPLITTMEGSATNRKKYLQRGINKLKDLEINYDEETKLFSEECKEFMKTFVDNIFLSDGYISQDDKLRFGVLLQQTEGREWFGKHIDNQRINNKEVDEFTFYRLVQYFAVCLFECNLSDDFGPATSIMNMCFTYHYISMYSPGRFRQPTKRFVYEDLKDQPIWKSLRFWNAAFLHAIYIDRARRTDGLQGWQDWDSERKKDFEIGEENSTFAHLASFLYMMKSLGMSRDDRDDFLEKMSTIGNLRAEQIHQLEESVEIL